MTKVIACDVLVVGAGASGAAAAIAAAHCGAKTILIEQNNFPGGEVVSGMHPYLCDLYINDAPYLLNKGIAQEINRELLSQGARIERMGKVNVLRFETSHFIRTLRKLSRRKNLKVCYGMCAQKVMVENGKIEAVTAEINSRLLKITPAAVVDASGAIIKKIKAAALRDNQKHLGGYCFKVCADCRDQFLGVKIGYALNQAIKGKKLPWYFRLTYTTRLNTRRALIKMSIPYSPTHIKRARHDAIRLFNYLKQTMPEFKTGKIIKDGTLLERSGVRLNARKILTAADVLSGKHYLSGVAARGSWPIEFWGERGVEYAYCQKNHYDISLDCLKAKNITNLFACGRFIGAETKALASVRVAGICLATGEAAGKLAAHFALRP
jgi:FAD dependent oxidoreductase